MNKKKSKADPIISILGIIIVLFILCCVLFGFFSIRVKGTVKKSEEFQIVQLETDFPSKEERVLDENIVIVGNGLKTTETKSDTSPNVADAPETDDEYILANSAKQLLKPEDIKELTVMELNYAKNEIYARHGRKFQSRELQTYFEGKSWYKGIYESSQFNEGSLTQIEKKNAELLAKREFDLQPGGYLLDQ